MLNTPSESNAKQEKRTAYFIPDPWETDIPVKPKSGYSSSQFPLRPDHEISAAPSAEGLLSAQGHPDAFKLTPNPRHNATTVLLEEEMKVDATQGQSLWDHIRDVFALLWWSKVSENTG